MTVVRKKTGRGSSKVAKVAKAATGAAKAAGGAAKAAGRGAAKAAQGVARGAAKGVRGVARGAAKGARGAAKGAHGITKSSVGRLAQVAKIAAQVGGKSKDGRMSHQELTRRALEYHSKPRPGKIEVVPTKPVKDATDLSLAYSPGVAIPCIEIENDPEKANVYTNKGNLVGIITNGSAVLGLGNIGALASKPVMEGKAMLFKLFADVDVFDIEVNTDKIESFIETVTTISDTFGAINLEDIAAPDCFTIEEVLRARLNIPVLHDDQSGTAVVAVAALVNAMEIQNKKPCDVRIVCVGAGAAGIGILRLCREHFGFGLNQIHLFDSKGLVTTDRPDLSTYKLPYAEAPTKDDSLAQVIKGADILIGVSRKNLFTQSMISSMAPNPIILAMANPDPEIWPEKVHAVRSDAIIATGRSDYPNQVNNSVCFPYLFRGALDARAKKFTPPMLYAAVDGLAKLAREPVPSVVKRTNGNRSMKFGPNYILPKQNDPRLLGRIAPAVMKAYKEE